MEGARSAEAVDQANASRALYEMIAGKWISQAIYAAAELGIADILKQGPRSAAEIARIANASEDGISRLLRALASLGLLSSGPNCRFALTPLGMIMYLTKHGTRARFPREMGNSHDREPAKPDLFRR